MDYKPILGATLGLQSTALLAQNAAYLRRKKKKKRSMLGLGVTNMAGIGLINAQASMI